jgi:hypothetical protein
MATLLDLFKSKKNELYGKSENIRIESRGILNPPRAAALIASSPDTLADLIGSNAAGLIKGSANRPSDTIFKGPEWYKKPLSITGVTTAELRDAVESGTDYFVKKSPAPNVVGGFLQGASNPAGAAANTLIKAVNSYGSAKKIKGLLKKLKDGPSQLPDNPEQYGTKFMPETKYGKEVIKDKDGRKFSDYYRDSNGKLAKRDKTGKGTDWDSGQQKLLEAISITNEEISKPEYANHVITTFETIPTNGKTSIKVPFVGSISGISEEISPTWNSFKYLGSPFNIYRYNGVERSLRFNLKLYYTTIKQRDAMIVKMNYLKSLAFPDTDVKAITFSSTNISQYAMAPNLVKITIGSLYKELPGYVESLSFEISDDATWPNSDSYDAGTDTTFLYPSVIDVNLSVKVIENHKIESGTGTTKTYRYDFNGGLAANERLEEEKAIKKQIQDLLMGIKIAKI